MQGAAQTGSNMQCGILPRLLLELHSQPDTRPSWVSLESMTLRTIKQTLLAIINQPRLNTQTEVNASENSVRFTSQSTLLGTNGLKSLVGVGNQTAIRKEEILNYFFDDVCVVSDVIQHTAILK